MAHPSQKGPTAVQEKGSVGGQEGGVFQMASSLTAGHFQLPVQRAMTDIER
jgi:hypothetical protein